MAYEAMSDKVIGYAKKKAEEELKKQFSEKASDKSTQASVQAGQADSPQLAMQKAVASKRIEKQQESSKNNIPNQNNTGGANTMASIAKGASVGSSKSGDKEKRDSVFKKTMDAGVQSGGDPVAMATAAVVGALEEGAAIRQERVDLEREAKEEEAKGLQNVGDIWTALAGQMKGLLR